MIFSPAWVVERLSSKVDHFIHEVDLTEIRVLVLGNDLRQSFLGLLSSVVGSGFVERFRERTFLETGGSKSSFTVVGFFTMSAWARVRRTWCEKCFCEERLLRSRASSKASIRGRRAS